MSIKNRYIFNQMAVAKGWLIKTFLLLLLLFVACGEPDDMFGTIHGDDEEIELTINTLLPDGGISTRTAPAENITSITALAFDRNHELIKVQTSEVVQSTTSNTTGTFKVTVPQRTRRIHFIAKNNGEFAEITESDYGKTDVGLLVNRISSIQNSQDADGISNALHYWQMLDFDSAEDLKDLSDELQALDKKTDDGYQLPLIRNMAKITLNLQNGMTGHIAGILNYNTTGTIVPYLKDGNNYTFGYQDKTNHELPSTFVITSDVSDCSELGTVHYLFEEYDDVGDLIYVMCYIDNDGSGTEDSGHFYKVALVKPTFTGVEDKYYYVIRNQAYNINIVGKLDVTLGKTNYSDAVQNAKPINDNAIEQVHLDFEPDEVYMYIGETGNVTVKIPSGLTLLRIGYSMERFDDGGISVKTTDGTERSKLNIPDPNPNDNIYVDTYDVTGLSEIVLSMNLKNSITEAISDMQIQFKGSGESKIADDKLVVHVLKRDALNVTPTAVEIPRTKGNSFSVNVIIPSFDNYDGAYELTINDKNNKYNITAPGTLVLQDGVYNVEKGQTYTFAFELREDGTAGDKHTIDFYLDTDYHDYDATTTVTLIDNTVHDQDYEIWVDNSTWTGTENSVMFFGYNKETPQGSFTTGTTPNGFRTEFYDTGANSHKSQSMVMGSDDSFTFTIPEGENRYLTMLVAANDGTSPSINLTGNLINGTSWTTANSGESIVPSNYNFGNAEINSNGRLIRYELAPGTYTLQRGSADYLLYYMRLTREKPEMTDVAQPLITDYTLNWSGGAYANTDGKGLLKLSNTKYIIDQDNLTHTIAFNSSDNSLETSLNLSTFSLNSVELQVETNRYSFSSNDSNNYTTETHSSKYSNLTNNLDKYNGGNYELSGTINNPNYKYSGFYENLHLEPVTYEVKNPIMPLLYNSMEAQRDPVEEFKSTDEAWAIGFGMPLTMPTSVVGTRIDVDIPNWKKYLGEGSDTGLGVHIEDEDSGSYYLLTQDDVNNENKIHPRPEWVYKIRWDANSVSAYQMIAPELENTDANNNNDIYFSYKGTIAKRVEIPTPYTVVDNPLNISLDFYADVDGNGTIDNNGNNFNDLLLGTSRVYLKATLSGNIPSSGTVQLQGEFNSPYQWANANGAIHWDNSKQDDNSDNDDIRYYGNDHNGTGLEFDIVTGKTEYLIDWVFVTGGNYSGSGDIQFTYRLSNNQGYTVTGDVGDAAPTFAFVNEPISNGQIQVATNSQSGTTASIPLYYGQNSSEEFTVDVTIPAGVTQLNIQADDFNVSRVNGNNIDNSTSITTTGGETMRLKFTLKDGSHTDKNSTITFSGNNNVSSATVNVDLSPRDSESSGVTTIWNGWAQLNWAYGINYLSTGYQIPVGSVVTLNFTTTGGSIKLHDVNGGANIIALPGRDYGNNDNLGIIPVNSGDTSFSFNVTNEIKVNNQNINGYLNGLKINGENVILTSVVVSTSGSSPTETVLINYNFDNNTQPNGYESVGGTSRFENGILSFTATGTGSNDYDNQIRFTGLSIVNGATYKLTFKIKSNVSDSTGLDIAFDDPSDNYSWCGRFPEISDNSLKLNDSGNFTEVTLTTTATKTINNARLFINLGHLGACTIEIDDLKLVRTN